MLVVETQAEIAEDGTLTAKIGSGALRGTRRVVIVIDEEPRKVRRPLPDLREFREKLGAEPYPGNSAVDLRNEERPIA